MSIWSELVDNQRSAEVERDRLTVRAEAIVGQTMTSGSKNVYGDRTPTTVAGEAAETTTGAAVKTTGADLTYVLATGATTGVAGNTLKVGRLDNGILVSGSSKLSSASPIQLGVKRATSHQS